MAHLSGFGLENFRVFKDYTWFDFAPITILVGPNSSGKSSLIKALLLLKDNYERNTLLTRAANSILKFDGGLHSLSSGKNILNNASDENQFKFVFNFVADDFSVGLKYEFIFKTDNDITYKHSYVSLRTETNELLFRLTNQDVYLNIPRLIECLIPNEYLLAKLANLKEPEVEDVLDVLDHHAYDSSKDELESRLQRLKLVRDFFINKSWKFNTASFSKYYDENKPFMEEEWVDRDEDGNDIWGERELTYEEFLSKEVLQNYVQSCRIIFKESGSDWLTEENSKQATQAFHGLLEMLHLEKDKKIVDTANKFSQLSSMIYLPSIKGQSKRSYQSNEDHVINTLIKNFRESPITTLDEYFYKWQKLFGIEKIAIRRDDRLDANYITLGDRSLTDLGYGLSQLTALLIMVGLRDKQKGNIFLLEEPEANMHPKYQSQLADVFAEAKNQNQFIIETHSEYIIRKFQYLVAKGEMKPEDVVIYYFNDPNNVPKGEKQVKKINILEDGSLSDDFGPGFFDEAATWELELLKLKKSKARQN